MKPEYYFLLSLAFVSLCCCGFSVDSAIKLGLSDKNQTWLLRALRWSYKDLAAVKQHQYNNQYVS